VENSARRFADLKVRGIICPDRRTIHGRATAGSWLGQLGSAPLLNGVGQFADPPLRRGAHREGCGSTGTVTPLIAAQGYTVTGFDIHARCVEVATGRLRRCPACRSSDGRLILQVPSGTWLDSAADRRLAISGATAVARSQIPCIRPSSRSWRCVDSTPQPFLAGGRMVTW